MNAPLIIETPGKNRASAVRLPRMDPFSLFTNHQWYFHQARQTVFFAAFSSEAPDRGRLIDMADAIVANIPQLGALYAALNSKPLDRDVLSEIVTCEEVAELDAYPDGWDMSGAGLFTRHDLPMLRIRAVVRRGGPDGKGRRSAILILSTHALLEGADSALLSRSQPAGHQNLGAPALGLTALKRLRHRLTASLLGPAQLLIALAIAPRQIDMTNRSLALSREKLRRVAARLGIRQRVLMFAIACFALNRGRTGLGRRRISAIYTEIDARNRAHSAGEFFRHRVLEASFRLSPDFVTFARNIDTEITRVEKKDNRATQGQLNAVFGMHRVLRRWLPFAYSDRIFRFAGFYAVNLSITPPHRLQGPLTEGMMEPIYAGTFHPGLDMCIFVPGRKQVTLNFVVHAKRVDTINAVAEMLDDLDR